MSISFRMNIFVALIIPRSVRTFCAFNFVPRIIYATVYIYVYNIYFFLPHYIYLAPQYHKASFSNQIYEFRLIP